MITEMSFPTRIVFGKGALREVPNNLARLGVKRPLLVTDGGVVATGIFARLTSVLEGAHVPFGAFDGVDPNPTGATVDRGLAAYREAGCDGVVAIGGGSPPHAAKGGRRLPPPPPPPPPYAHPPGGRP